MPTQNRRLRRRLAALPIALTCACAGGGAEGSTSSQPIETNPTAGSAARPTSHAGASAAGRSSNAPAGSASTSASAGSSANPGRASNAGARAAAPTAGQGSTSTAASSGSAGDNATAAPAAGSATAAPAAGSGSAADNVAGASAAGSGSAGSTAPAGGNAPSSCPGSLCESFEASSGDSLDPSWEVSTANCTGTGSAAMDSTMAHGGTRSVRVNGGGGYCNHVFVRPKMSPISAGQSVYARFFVRFEKPLTQSHVTFLALRDEAEMKDLRMGGQSEILMWNRESDDATLPELSPTGIGMSAKPEPGKWLCVEFLIDGQTPKLETWLEGEPVAGLVVEGEPTPDVDAQWQRKADWRPMLSDIRFGWESYGSDENTLWFDDLVLGTSRVGCGS